MSPPQPALTVSSSLEEVRKRSQALLEEEKNTGFPGKADRSREVVNLFGQLRAEIVDYHVSELVTEPESTR